MEGRAFSAEQPFAPQPFPALHRPARSGGGRCSGLAADRRLLCGSVLHDTELPSPAGRSLTCACTLTRHASCPAQRRSSWGARAGGGRVPHQGTRTFGTKPLRLFQVLSFFVFFLDLDLCRVNICDLCNRHFLPGGQDAAPDKYYFFCLTGCFVSPLPNAHCRGRHPCFANAQAALVPFWSCICYSPPLLFRWSPCLQPGVSSVCAKSVQCWLCEVNYCRTPRTFSAGVANLQSTENKGGARRLHPHCACLQKDARASADKPLAVSGHF